MLAAQILCMCMSGRLLHGRGGVPDAQRVRQERFAGDVLVSATLLPWPNLHPVMTLMLSGCTRKPVPALPVQACEGCGIHEHIPS